MISRLSLAASLLLLSTTSSAGLVGGTFIGVAGENDSGSHVAVAPNGDLYVTGQLRGQLDLDGVPGFDSTYGSDPVQHPDDVFVARYDATFSTLKGFTYLGGDSLDWVKGLRVDGEGNVFVLVHIGSSDLNVTPSGYDAQRDGSVTGLLVKLDAGLEQVLGATYVEGDANSGVTMIALCLDGDGNPVVVGGARDGFPATAGAFDAAYAEDPDYPWNDDVIVAKYDASLDTLLGATYLGGTQHETARTCAVTPDGDLVISGITSSGEFPVTSGAWDTTPTELDGGAYREGFVTRLSGDLSTLVASTLLTSQGRSAIKDLAVDSAGNIFVVGDTEADPFPEGAAGDEQNAFVVKFSGDLTTLAASRTLTYTRAEYAFQVAVDSDDRVIFGGTSFIYGGEAFPISDGAWSPESYSHSVAALMRFDNDLVASDFSTVAGGYFGADTLLGMALGADGTLFFTGYSQTANFPVPATGHQSQCAGGDNQMACYDAFALALAPDGPVQPPRLGLTVDGNRVATQWPAVTGAAGYRLHYAPAPYTGPETIGSVELGEATTLAVDLPAGSSFFVAVEGYDADGAVSGYSNIEQFTIE